jgi:hypothetical protein
MIVFGIILVILLFVKPKQVFPSFIHSIILEFTTKKESIPLLLTSRTFFDVFMSSHNADAEKDLTAIACAGLALKYFGHNRHDLIRKISKHHKLLLDAYPKLEHILLKTTHYNLYSLIPLNTFDYQDYLHNLLLFYGCVLLDRDNLVFLQTKQYRQINWLFWINICLFIYQTTMQVFVTTLIGLVL